MHLVLFAVVVSFLAVGTASAQQTVAITGGPPVRVHGPLDVAKSLIATEQAFDRRSVSAGAAVAMRDFMDPTDGLTFTGGEPGRGAAAIFAAHSGVEWQGKLSWAPSEVFASSGGDMGAVWGHFRFTPPAKGAPVVTGRYVTVWRKTPAGAWKGIIDIGNPD